MVLVQLCAGNETGVGYTYADKAAVSIIEGMLREVVTGADAFDIPSIYAQMVAKIRNNGRSGITAMAISAVDIALWDVKAKLLGVPAAVLLGRARETVPVYGSGGFTSFDVGQLRDQLGGWVHGMGIPRVKMKIGREPQSDPARVRAARSAIGNDAQLFVDANGAYSVTQALAMAQTFAESGVTWFEEPVYHNDLRGNGAVARAVPPGMDVSNGEYGYAPYEFAEIIAAGAAHVVQADVTRCGGYSGFLAVDALCEAHDIPLSSHCAPYVTLPGAAAAKTLRHVEYFADHVRIEQMFFEGTADPQDGALTPDLSRPGIGLAFRAQDAQRFTV